MLIAWKKFDGEIPRSPDYALPDHAAVETENCDLAYGELRGLRQPFLLKATVQAVKSAYTYDGLHFATWNRTTFAVKAPITNDAHDRFYYTDGQRFMVSTHADLSVNGGSPAVEYQAGVGSNATVTVAPGSPSSDLTSVAIYARVWNQSGTTINSNVVPVRTLTAYGVEEFNIPMSGTVGSDTVVTLTGWDSGSKVFEITSDNNERSTLSANSWYPALPSLSIIGGHTTSTVQVRLTHPVYEVRHYVATQVNQWGEESAPSEVASYEARAPVLPKVTVVLPLTSAGPPVISFRLYRSNSGTEATRFQFVEERNAPPGSTTTFDDKIERAELAEVLPTAGWQPPPQTLTGLCASPNGFLAAFRGSEVWFSEQNVPYAWDPLKAITLPYEVRGLVPHGGGFVVTTGGHPYYLAGTTPGSMSVTKLHNVQPGVHPRGVADLGDAVVYTSDDGLVFIVRDEATLDFTHHFFTRETWRERFGDYLQDLTLAVHDGALIGLFPNRNGFVIRLDEAKGAYSTSTIQGNDVFRLPQMDALYVARNDGVYTYDDGGLQNFRWKSKPVTTPLPTNFGACEVVLGGGSVSVSVYADGTLVRTFSATGEGSHKERLPAGFRARRWQVEVTSSTAGTRLQELYLATTLTELKNS